MEKVICSRCQCEFDVQDGDFAEFCPGCTAQIAAKKQGRQIFMQSQLNQPPAAEKKSGRSKAEIITLCVVAGIITLVSLFFVCDKMLNTKNGSVQEFHKHETKEYRQWQQDFINELNGIVESLEEAVKYAPVGKKQGYGTLYKSVKKIRYDFLEQHVSARTTMKKCLGKTCLPHLIQSSIVVGVDSALAALYCHVGTPESAIRAHLNKDCSFLCEGIPCYTTNSDLEVVRNTCNHIKTLIEILQLYVAKDE